MTQGTDQRGQERLDEQRLVRGWRQEQFAALGFPPAEVRRLAAARVDLGDMRRLIGAGCPLETARRILL
jgi:hypothetical protein